MKEFFQFFSWRWRLRSLSEGGRGDSQEKKVVLPPEEPIAAESFDMNQQADHSILVGRFVIKGQVMLVSHSQWEGDSHPLTVIQRREILRRTIQERLRKIREYRKN